MSNITVLVLFAFSLAKRIDAVDKGITVTNTTVCVIHAKVTHKSVEEIKCAVMEWSASSGIAVWLSCEEA